MTGGLDIHLFGVTPDEAEAALAEQGEPATCSYEVPEGEPPTVGLCPEEPVMMLMYKRPGNAWGDGIKSTTACERHRSGLETVIKKISTGATKTVARKKYD